MPQPSFLSEGVTPRLTDTRWAILVKWLGELQNQAGAIVINNPKRNDTRRILLGKIESALAGVAFPG